MSEQKRKPVVGETLYRFEPKHRRNTEATTEVVVVSKVGRKYFTAHDPKDPRYEGVYDLNDWIIRDSGYNERVNCPSMIFESLEQIEAMLHHNRVREEFLTWTRSYPNSLTTEQMEQILKIAKGGSHD